MVLPGQELPGQLWSPAASTAHPVPAQGLSPRWQLLTCPPGAIPGAIPEAIPGLPRVVCSELLAARGQSRLTAAAGFAQQGWDEASH